MDVKEKEFVMAIRHMRENIEEIVDFEKLKKSNDTCHKWCKRFKIKKMYYVRFMFNIFKNPEQHVVKLPAKYKLQFLEDCKSMFYAAEVENVLIEQYNAMVFNIMKKMHISCDDYDDFVTDGLMAIRAAVWQYRTYKIKASFTTYVHRSIFMRIRGRLHKEKLKKLTRKNLKINRVSDFESEEFNLENLKVTKDYSANTENINLEIEKIIVGCSLTDQEAMLLRSFVDRKIDVSIWYADYIKKYINKKLNKPFTRQSIYNHLEIVHEKIFSYLQAKGVLPDGYIKPRTRRGDFK